MYSIVKFASSITRIVVLLYLFVVLPLLMIAGLVLAFAAIPPILWLLSVLILALLYGITLLLDKLETKLKPVEAEITEPPR